ncbi:MAG: type II toxin-antitoxin system VapC family toxin [Planctomycetota bacterium]|nr:type II toxin-antitoxin system VapC family toxin [Planctomycetota bacterium]MDA1106770.1 type II toxin-antitoxin system VapC family toxin [Planctomycetota bacterium]
MIADTTFLIDLEREVKRRTPGRAAGVLASRQGVVVGVSVVASAELSEGYDDASRTSVARFLQHFELLPVDAETAWIWSRLSQRARSEGRVVGDNDLWIAATAARHARPLITRNARDFADLPGVVVLAY